MNMLEAFESSSDRQSIVTAAYFTSFLAIVITIITIILSEYSDKISKIFEH